MSELKLTMSEEAEQQLAKILFKNTRDLLDEMTSRQVQATPYMNRKATANYIGISEGTLDKWETQGLKSIKINGLKLFAKDTVDNWLISQEK